MSSSEDEDILHNDEEVPMKLISDKISVEPPKQKSLEDLLQLKWYCLLVLIMAELTAFTSSASKTMMVYAGATPNVVGCGDQIVNGCHEYINLRNTTNCKPVMEYQFESVQVEFEYVCNDAKKVKNTITVQTFGVLIGAAIFGQISDTYGRRKALILACLGNAIFNCIAAYSPDLFYFTLWRTISGIFAGGLTVVQMVFMVENIPRQHRMWIQNSITWSPNLIIFPIAAYYSHDWRTLSNVIAAVSVLSFLALLFLEESPRWLVQKGKIDEARKIFQKIRHLDNSYTDEFAAELENVLQAENEKAAKNANKSKKYTFIHLFCTWTMIAQTLTFITGIICTTFIVYALMYNMEKLSGSLYWNSAIFGASRWAVNIAVSVLDYNFQWFGRRIVNQLSMTFTMFGLGLVGVYVYFGETGPILSIGTTIAIAMCSQLFIAKYLMVNELYPTAVRNLAVSAVSTMSRIGSMFSPQLFYLSDYAEWLPYAVLFAFQFYDLIVFSIFLPETKGIHLENHLPPKSKRIFRRKK